MINFSRKIYTAVNKFLNRYLGSYPNFLQFVNFCIIGASVAVIDFGLLIILKELVGINQYLANTTSLIVALTTKFFLHRYWVFKDQADTNKSSEKKKFIKFLTVSTAGIGINNTVILLFSLSGFSGHYWFYFSKIIATIMVLFWNFVVNKFWTFRREQV